MTIKCTSEFGTVYKNTISNVSCNKMTEGTCNSTTPASAAEDEECEEECDGKSKCKVQVDSSY